MLDKAKKFYAKYHLAIWFFFLSGAFSILGLSAQVFRHDLLVTVICILFEYFYFILGAFQVLSVRRSQSHVK